MIMIPISNKTQLENIKMRNPTMDDTVDQINIQVLTTLMKEARRRNGKTPNPTVVGMLILTRTRMKNSRGLVC